MVGDIKQSEISFKEFFNNNPEFESIIFESDEIKNRGKYIEVNNQRFMNKKQKNQD